VHTATQPPTPPVPVLTGLGQALRWLRERQARKQYQVASAAGITKGMLSAYETGRQRPSLETLDKLLETLGCDLNDLHNALQIVNGRPELMKGWRGGGLGPPMDASAWPDDHGPGTPANGSHGFFDSGRYPAPGQSLPPARSQSSSAMPDLASLAQMPRTYQGLPQPSWPPQTPRTSELASEVHEPTRVTGDLRQLLGLLGPPGETDARQASLPPEEELALAQMLEGFHNLLRYWHRCLRALAATGSVGPAGPTAPTAGEPPPPTGLPESPPPAPALQKATPLQPAPPRQSPSPARGSRQGRKGGD
jgi:DNA-binding XRE family transcriptional regulator